MPQEITPRELAKHLANGHGVRLIDVRSLDTWDPEMCVSVYAALLTALRAIKPPIVDAGPRESFIIEKICRLDPALAVRMGI